MASNSIVMSAGPMNYPVQLTLVCPTTHHAYQETLCYVMQSHDYAAHVLYKDPS